MERAASPWRRSPGHSPCRRRYLYLPAVVWGTPQSCSGRTDCRKAAALTRRGVLQLLRGGIRIAAALTGGGGGASTTGKRDTRIRSPLPSPLSPLPPLRQSPLPLPPLPLPPPMTVPPPPPSPSLVGATRGSADDSVAGSAGERSIGLPGEWGWAGGELVGNAATFRRRERGLFAHRICRADLNT